jgi:hypothetical protein
MNDFESSITTAKQHINSILAEQREKKYESDLEAATYIAARSQAASEAAKGKEPLNRKERSWFNQQVKPLEETVLKAWAKKISLWIDDEQAKKIAKRYIDEGAEQKVYLKEDGRSVLKINTGIFHGTWLDFFVRLIIHKTLFPSTAYELKGFTEAEEQICAIIEQPGVKVVRGIFKEEADNYLKPLGFINIKNYDYYNKQHGIILEDLHDENVFVGKENNLLFVDPVIYLETPDLGYGGTRLFHFPFNSR